MAKMYFDENPDAIHDIHKLNLELLDLPMIFFTDSGVFSKKQVDYGSKVLLENLTFKKDDTLLDVGCGYGPLGLTLAKKFGVLPTMVDINQRALGLAQKNSEANGIDANVYQSNVYDQVEGKFDHIISNPPIRAGKDIVHKIITESYDHLNDQGDLTLVIQKKQGAPSAKKKMLEIFDNVEIVAKDKGYYILRSVKNGL
jgi:16S RNA G1207 methylase RsmC